MNTTLSFGPASLHRAAALVLGLMAVAFGLLVLLGWAIGSDALKSIFPGQVTMKANTAVGLALCGGSLTLLARADGVPQLRHAALPLAGMAVVLGLFTLSQYFFSWNLGIDELLFRDSGNQVATAGPGRMAPSTAFCFTLTGVALGMLSRPTFPRVRLPVVSAMGATLVVIGGAGTLGQLANGIFRVDFWNFSGMAIHTALGFVSLGAGLIEMVRSEQGITWALDATTSLGFIAAVAIMLSVAGVSWNYTYRLQQQGVLVTHSSEILREIENIRAGMAGRESSQRGYVILGDEHLLDQRVELTTGVRKDIGILRQLTIDDPVQQQRLKEIETLTEKRTVFGDQVIEARRQSGFPAAQKMIATGVGTALTADFKTLITAMRDSEYAMLVARQKAVSATATSTFLLLPSGIFLSLSILSLALFFLNTGMAEERQTRESLRLLASIVDSSNDAIISKELDSTVTSWNTGAERVFGYTAAEMVGQSITRLIPQDRLTEETRIIEQVRKGERVDHFETLRVAKDGRMLNVSVTASPIKDKAGHVIGASKVARDITEQKTAQEALRQSEKRLQTMIDALPQLAFMAHPDGSVFWYNQRWYDYTGTTLKQMENVGWKQLHDPNFLPKVLEEWGRAVATASPFEMEFPLRAADGTFGWFLARVVPVKDVAGKVVLWFGTNTDLSLQRAAAEEIRELNVKLEQRVIERTAELEAANKELEAFSYSVSHDLRSPLRAIDGFSQAVIEDCAALLPEQGRSDLHTIRASAQRMGRLIDDLLAFSRLGRAPIKLLEINTTRMVRDVLDELRDLQANRKVEIVLKELPPCRGDAALLNQVWINLLSNALKYTSNCPVAVIEIGSRVENDTVVYTVRDNGAGFDMRYAQKLFGVFQRLHRLDEFEGTGVGLAIVHRVITRHGGRIWADAKPGCGATFHFTLNEAATT